MWEEPGERVFDIPDEPPFDLEEPPVLAAAAPVKPAAPKPVESPRAAEPVAAKPAAAAVAPAVDKNWWKALAESCKGRLPPMYRAFLDMCTGVLSGDLLTVYAPDDITLGRLNNDRVKGALSEEAAKAAGMTVRVVVLVGDAPQASPEENFKNLLKFSAGFDNITIK